MIGGGLPPDLQVCTQTGGTIRRDVQVLMPHYFTSHDVTIVGKTHGVLCQVDLAPMSIIKVPVQIFLLVKGLAAEATSPLGGSVLMFGLLLWVKYITGGVERTFQR
uniref:Uncharacterized protein n=1 Tax=Cacopsylla melanoneura TaxID=428564 RepID=A0A8D8WVW7_9HEMI